MSCVVGRLYERLLLKKIEVGTFDATFLAVAGLKRLGLSDKVTRILDAEEMLPAVCQGALGLGDAC